MSESIHYLGDTVDKCPYDYYAEARAREKVTWEESDEELGRRLLQRSSGRPHRRRHLRPTSADPNCAEREVQPHCGLTFQPRR